MADVWANSMACHPRAAYHILQVLVIPEPHVTLQGVRIQSAILKIVFRHILFFLFLMQFRLWRAAAFVSSAIHLLLLLRTFVERKSRIKYTKCAKGQYWRPVQTGRVCTGRLYGCVFYTPVHTRTRPYTPVQAARTFHPYNPRSALWHGSCPLSPRAAIPTVNKRL